MKRMTLIVVLTLVGILGYAQSTNPLNYSGRMYVEAFEIYATPRYISYEDHAILSQQTRIPIVEITSCDMDFEKGAVTMMGKEMKVKVTDCKKHEDDFSWNVVVYMELIDEGDKAELVWPEFGKPYLQQITQSDDGVNIVRIILSKKPYVASESDALMDLLEGLGTL